MHPLMEPQRKRSQKHRITKKEISKPNSASINPVRKNKYSKLIGLIIISLLGIIIYSNSFYCSFHFDDLLRIVQNTSIRNLADIKTWWNYYPTRPFGTFIFVLNYHFAQLDVWYWHLVNLIIHLMNACLIGWITLLIFSTPVLRDQPIARNKNILALVMALLFVSHPLATQSVTYIVQRLASTVALFYLLSIALYVKARLSNQWNIVRILLFTGSFISAVIAMLTKENAFTLPFAIVLFEFFFLRIKKPSINFKDYRVILFIGLFLSVILIIPLKMSLNIFKSIPSSYMNTVTITPLNYLFTQFSVIVKYIQLLFLPIHQNLDYDFPVSNSFFDWNTLLSFLFLGALIVLAILSFKKYRIISFGIFWFFLTLSIESSIIPIRDVIFEHRTYLPSFGFFLILSSGIYILLWKRFKNLAIFLFIIIIVSNSYLTYERNKVWKNDLTLWSDIVQKSPNKPRPLYNLGMVYDYLEQWDNSIDVYSRAVNVYPKDLDAYINRGVAYGNLGHWDKAVADYTMAIGIDPKLTKPYSNRGIAYGNLQQWEKAAADDARAIELDPKSTVSFYNLGIADSYLGNWSKAIEDESRAIEIDPNYTNAYNYRGIAYGNLKQWDKSIIDFSKTLEIDPKFATAYYNRGNAYYYMGQMEKAIADYTKSIELDPKSARVFFNRAMAYGTLGQWDKAIADYNSTIQIDPNYTQAYSSRDLANKMLHVKKK